MGEHFEFWKKTNWNFVHNNSFGYWLYKKFKDQFMGQIYIKITKFCVKFISHLIRWSSNLPKSTLLKNFNAMHWILQRQETFSFPSSSSSLLKTTHWVGRLYLLLRQWIISKVSVLQYNSFNLQNIPLLLENFRYFFNVL